MGQQRSHFCGQTLDVAQASVARPAVLQAQGQKHLGDVDAMGDGALRYLVIDHALAADLHRDGRSDHAACRRACSRALMVGAGLQCQTCQHCNRGVLQIGERSTLAATVFHC